MSQPVIGDNSCSSKSSDNDQSKDDMRSFIRMIKSSNPADKRFIDLYKVKRAHEHGVEIEHSEIVDAPFHPSQHLSLSPAEENQIMPDVDKTRDIIY